MTNAAGDIIVKDGIANLNGVKFNMLGGAFVVNGTYDTKDINHPKYNFGLKIDGLSIQQAATSFTVVKTYAPIAGLVNGNFSTDFQLAGELGKDMMPKMEVVNGAGTVKVAQAALTNSKFVSGLTSLTKLNDTDQVSIKDVLMSAVISNGRFSVKPFDMKLGSYTANVSGSSGLDKSVDYSIKMNIPSNALASQFQSQLNSLAGTNNSTSEIPVTIAVGGTAANPTFKLSMAEQKQQIKEAATKVVEQKSQEAVKQLSEGAKPEDVVKNLLKTNKQDSVKKDSAAKAQPTQPVQQQVDQLQNKLNNLLKKKKN
jgi:hypothetical protein